MHTIILFPILHWMQKHAIKPIVFPDVSLGKESSPTITLCIEQKGRTFTMRSFQPVPATSCGFPVCLTTATCRWFDPSLKGAWWLLGSYRRGDLSCVFFRLINGLYGRKTRRCFRGVTALLAQSWMSTGHQHSLWVRKRLRLLCRTKV